MIRMTLIARNIASLLVATALLLSGCDASIAQLGATPTPTCADQVRPYLDAIQPIAHEWDDANKLAGNAPRMSLAPQIASLQSIRRRTADVSVPACTAALHRKLVDSMDKTIEGYLSFLSQKPDSQVSALFREAGTLMNNFTTELAALTPSATPTK